MGLTPTGDEAEMVPESQRRMSSALSDQQVSFKHELARILSTSTFQTMSQTVDADDDDKAEKRKSSAPSDQVEKGKCSKNRTFCCRRKEAGERQTLTLLPI